MSDQRRGFAFGLGAHFLWGLMPLYWKLLHDSGAIELLSHRIVWSMVTIVALILIRRRFAQVRAILSDPRRRWALVAAAFLISANWAGFIWGVTNDHVVETSLGYFITPLFTVLLGVVVLHERLRPAQWVALGIAFLAVAGLAIEYGRPPWVALVLTFSFGFYGLVKKKVNTGAVEGMAIETAVVTPLALAVVVALTARGDATATANGPGYFALMVLGGPLTALPLLLFGGAATRISLTTLGLLQYLGPSLQFLLGVIVYHEAMSVMRWVGFGLVWLALVIFTGDGLLFRRRTLASAAARPVTSAA
jgi:chloramphenicol-sensitive protein RarD